MIPCSFVTYMVQIYEKYAPSKSFIWQQVLQSTAKNNNNLKRQVLIASGKVLNNSQVYVEHWQFVHIYP